MNVYFDENFWGCMTDRENRVPGEKIRIEKEFAWDGRTWRIPAVYICEEGVVIDFCIRIPSEEIESFLQKWKPQMEEVTEEERVCAERENPFAADAKREVWMDGKKAEGWSGCGTSWIPVHLRDESEAQAASGIEEKMLEAYGCDCRDGWSFKRMSVRWPEGVRLPVHTLTLRLKKGAVYYPGPHFRTVRGEGKKQVKFIHPATGKEHILTVQSLEQAVLPDQDFSEIKFKRTKIRKIPAHFLVMSYSVEPKLPLHGLRLADCAESDRPKPEKETGAAAVSVIGGAGGPIAVFLAGKTGEKGGRKEWERVGSSLHYEPVDEAEWRMEFYAESREQTEVSFFL